MKKPGAPVTERAWTEIERRIAAGGDPEELWECLFLREPEIAKFLDFVEQREAPKSVYPMCVMAPSTDRAN